MTKRKSKRFLIRKIRKVLNMNKEFFSSYKKSYNRYNWGAGISSSHMKEKY